MTEKWKLKKGDDKQNMINAEKLLAFDPGDLGNMISLFQLAYQAGFYDTVMWIGKIAMQANITRPKGGPDYKTFIILRDIYKGVHQWQDAVDACNWAAKMKPDDMDLQKELKDLGAQVTMMKGKYGVAKSFRESVRDMDKQSRLQREDSDVRTVDALHEMIVDAKKEYEAEPNEPGKLIKYVEVLRKTESPDFENQAIELLEEAFKRTGQFRWRKSAGEIKIIQMSRMERSMRQAYQANPADEDLKKQYAQFRREKLEEELKEYTLWAEHYPTESQFRYNMAARLFELGRHDEAIPLFQQIRQDPKYRSEAAFMLGRSFFESGFADEAVDTLQAARELHQIKGDAKDKEMTYWYGRALELKADIPAALKAYSQVFMIDSGYRDVQVRIKALRAQPKQG
jgi:tetratricopeptide (TPR) repeat protein